MNPRHPVLETDVLPTELYSYTGQGDAPQSNYRMERFGCQINIFTKRDMADICFTNEYFALT